MFRMSSRYSNSSGVDTSLSVLKTADSYADIVKHDSHSLI
jgi:hypothetical protein